MNNNYYNNYVYFYVASFSGIFAYLLISQIISYNRLLSFIGKNTLIILSLHTILISIVKGIQFFVFRIPLNILNKSIFWSLLYTIFVIVIATPIIVIINKYFSFLIGNFELPKNYKLMG